MDEKTKVMMALLFDNDRDEKELADVYSKMVGETDLPTQETLGYIGLLLEECLSLRDSLIQIGMLSEEISNILM